MRGARSVAFSPERAAHLSRAARLRRRRGARAVHGGDWRVSRIGAQASLEALQTVSARRRSSRRWRRCSSASRTSPSDVDGRCRDRQRRLRAALNEPAELALARRDDRAMRRGIDEAVAPGSDYRDGCRCAAAAASRSSTGSSTDVLVMADDAPLREARLALLSDFEDTDPAARRTFRRSSHRRSKSGLMATIAEASTR